MFKLFIFRLEWIIYFSQDWVLIEIDFDTAKIVNLNYFKIVLLLKFNLILFNNKQP